MFQARKQQVSVSKPLTWHAQGLNLWLSELKHGQQTTQPSATAAISWKYFYNFKMTEP